MNSFYEILIDTNNYNIIIINDFLRMFVIQINSQFLYSYMNNVEFLSPSFIENTSYILLSILVYWLVFNKIFYLTSKTNKDTNYDSNLPHYLRIR
jgi:hypothetical protein